MFLFLGIILDTFEAWGLISTSSTNNVEPSARKIHDVAQMSRRKTPGSVKYLRLWRHWSVLAIDGIRGNLKQNLPHPVDEDGFQELWFNLGVAADIGVMPSFEDAGARSGYALEFFCRARLLADMLIDRQSLPGFMKLELDKCFYHDDTEEKVCRMGSIGGGPGFDFVSAVLVSIFNSRCKKPTSIHALVYDYEEGWNDIVNSMSISTADALQVDNHFCKWGGRCDITESLSHENNRNLEKSVADMDLWVCQYCLAENSSKLRDNKFVFFTDLLVAAKEGAIIIITETTPRVWPDLIDALNDIPGLDIDVAFPRAMSGRGKKGPQLALRKQVGSIVSKEVMLESEKYRKVNMMHERKLRKGFVRQVKKVRGAK